MKAKKLRIFVNVTTFCFNISKYETRNTYAGADARLHAFLTAE
jgi:hypothetical protein